MRAKVEKGELSIDVMDFVQAMPPEVKREVAKYLCADEYLIKAVLDIVGSPDRFGHYFEDDEQGPWWFDPQTVLQIREKLIPLLGPVAKQLALEALRQRDAAESRRQRSNDWAWKMYHAWPERHWDSRPEMPDWMPRKDRPDEELLASIADKGAA